MERLLQRKQLGVYDDGIETIPLHEPAERRFKRIKDLIQKRHDECEEILTETHKRDARYLWTIGRFDLKYEISAAAQYSGEWRILETIEIVKRLDPRLFGGGGLKPVILCGAHEECYSLITEENPKGVRCIVEGFDVDQIDELDSMIDKILLSELLEDRLKTSAATTSKKLKI